VREAENNFYGEAVSKDRACLVEKLIEKQLCQVVS